MSSFNSPHHLYLFEMKNGKKKLAYGATSEEAYESLRFRLNEAEIEMIFKDRYVKIPQRELHQHVRELG
jgi:hypothetical protein